MGDTNKNRRAARREPGAIRPVRVRARPLLKVQEDKLALAFFLLAKDLVEDRTDRGEDATDEERAGAKDAS